MKFEAKVIEDSVSPAGVRLTTLQLCYPRFIHAEFMTHRVFSRNASSSRAIPVAKMIEQVRNEPAVPVHWGANQPGMQSRAEVSDTVEAERLWRAAAHNAAVLAEKMGTLGLHKQVANRILEPFQWMHVIMTATEWENFFDLRDHQDAEPNIQLLARMMKQAMAESIPVGRHRNPFYPENWHLPYVTTSERSGAYSPSKLARLSAARCARVSYLTHDGKAPDPTKDFELYERLVGGKPMHASPIEHQAYSMAGREQFSGNFRGWNQFRKLIETEM